MQAQSSLPQHSNRPSPTVVTAKPTSAKGKYVEKAAISSTMGPGLKLDVAEVASV